MNHYVYEITNLINGKKYIGKRSCHCSIEDDRYMGSGTLLKKAFIKYDKENFKKEIIEICKDNKEAFDREIYYIEQVKAYKNNNYYNIGKGGEGGFNNFAGKTEEELIMWRKRMSEARKGRIITKEWMSKIIKTRKENGVGVGESNGMYGRKGGKSPVSKPIVMLSIEGELLNKFDSGTLANGFLKKEKSNRLINKVCNSKKGTAYGYMWLFEEDYNKYKNDNHIECWIKQNRESVINNGETRAKAREFTTIEPIYQLDKETLEIIKKYDNINLASKDTKIDLKSIKRNCKHGSNTAGGYSWILVEEYNSISKHKLKQLYSYKYTKPSEDVYRKRKIPVYCPTIDKRFDGVSDALEYFQLPIGTKIGAVCKGNRKYAGRHPKTNEPLKWMYYEDYLKSKGEVACA